MSRTLHALMLLAVVGLSACASPQTQPLTAKPESPSRGFYAYGTLAPLGSIEWQLAPLYTRVIVIAKTAARRLDAGRIDPDIAATIEAKAKAAKSRIDEARASAARPEIYDARVHQATSLLDEADQLLREKSR